MSQRRENQTPETPDTCQGSISNKQMKAILEEYTNKQLVPERKSRHTKSRRTVRNEPTDQASQKVLGE